ncbi:MAG: hypothetical protein IT438_00510 [Phycisphaerales bacterium]|nr:hypothetical protein [Phycisphaerales bacterium]
MNRRVDRRVRAATLLIVAAGGSLSATSASAQVWLNNVPDTYQHQRWGARAAQNIPRMQANGNPVVPAANIAVAGAADARGDGTWANRGYFPGTAVPARPDSGFFYGLCFQASNVNQFYHFRQLGYKTFGGAGAGLNPANETQQHDQVQSFETAYNAERSALLAVVNNGALANAVRLDALKRINTPNLINSVLNTRGAGPNQGLAGLKAQNFKQVGNQVKYIGADGTEKFLGKQTLASHIPQLFRARDMANLRLAYPFEGADLAGTPQQGLWWAGTTPDGGNFHNVTVAGYDAAGAGGNGTIYFADPDSNPLGGVGANGNRNIDAGWVGTTADWKAAEPAAVPAAATAGQTKEKRFAAGAAVRVPGAFVAGQPPAADRTGLYYEGTLGAGRKEFDIAAGGFDRYDGVQIRYLETLETIKAIAKPAGAGGAGSAKGLSITTGAADAINRITDFWIFPSSSDEVITAATIPDGLDAGNWSIDLIDAFDMDSPLFIDDWGNERPFGGVHVSTLSGSLGAIEGGDLLDLEYETLTTLDLSAWDFIYNDRLDLSLESLGVQSYGGYAGYNLATEQIPAPGALGLFGLGLIFSAGRRRR